MKTSQIICQSWLQELFLDLFEKSHVNFYLPWSFSFSPCLCNRPAYRVEEVGKLLFFAARMKLVINFLHLALGQMGIDFSGGD